MSSLACEVRGGARWLCAECLGGARRGHGQGGVGIGVHMLFQLTNKARTGKSPVRQAQEVSRSSRRSVFRAVSASAETVTGSRAGSGVIIRHIASNSWEVIAGATSGEGESEAGSVASASPRSAQIRGAVSVQQGSLIRKACRYVRRACMWLVCCSN
jgi:hypothetical protein